MNKENDRHLFEEKEIKTCENCGEPGRHCCIEDLSFIRPSDLQFSHTLSLREMEKAYIQKILVENNWNVTQSAKILEINRVTLHKMIKRYRLERPEG